MVPQTTRSWVLANQPTDMPVISGSNQTFELKTRDLPELQDDQVLLKTVYLSNDPAQRGWISPGVKPERLYVPPVKVGSPMNARGLAEVIESKSSHVSKGSVVMASVGWNEYVVVDAKAVNPVSDLPGGLSLTHYLGALGMTGVTAYYGTKVVAEATKEDTIVVSGAAGATGSMAVQIAKNIIGCKSVIGLAGTDDKCRWVESLGADKCLNYKDKDFEEQLAKATPDYVSVFFDNVGGSLLDLMLTRMAKHGRIAACGAISNYNTSAPETLKNYFEIISMRLQIRGFIVMDYLSKAAETVDIFKKALNEGKLKIGNENEHVVSTKFEDVPKTWVKLFEGANTGKLITKLT